MKKKGKIEQKLCVACGCCVKVCKVGAIGIWNGVFAEINQDKCIGCGMCAKECPASVILMEVSGHE